MTKISQPYICSSSLSHPTNIIFGNRESVTENNWPETASPCYSVVLEKEDNGMSFVGFTFCEDRIIGFGDSRSTITDANGIHREDMERGYVKKIILTGQYIVAAYNTNVVIKKNENGLEEIFVEDWIVENLDLSPFDLFQKFYELLNHPDIKRVDSVYGLAIATKKDYGKPACKNCLLNATISSSNMDVRMRYVEDGTSWYAGYDPFVSYFSFYSSQLCSTDPAAIKNAIEFAIKERERVCPNQYCPVGHPIYTEEWVPV